jgi:hypothetical protein
MAKMNSHHPSKVRSPIVGLLNRGVSVARLAARENLTAKRSRPEMAPQQLEKIESAPGNGMVSETSIPQHLVHGAWLPCAPAESRKNHKVESDVTPELPPFGVKRPSLIAGVAADSGSFLMRFILVLASKPSNPGRYYRGRTAREVEGNFPPRNPLKSLKTEKESRKAGAPAPRRFKFRIAVPRRPDISTLSPRAVRRA